MQEFLTSIHSSGLYSVTKPTNTKDSSKQSFPFFYPTKKKKKKKTWTCVYSKYSSFLFPWSHSSRWIRPRPPVQASSLSHFDYSMYLIIHLSPAVFTLYMFFLFFTGKTEKKKKKKRTKIYLYLLFHGSCFDLVDSWFSLSIKVTVVVLLDSINGCLPPPHPP